VPSASTRKQTTSNGDITGVARKAAITYLDGVEQAVEQIGDFQVTLAERFLGKPGASLAEAQVKATKQVTSALVRVQREVIGV